MDTITVVDRSVNTSITREEIVQVERMLKVIDLRFRAFNQATLWLGIWTVVQELTVKFTCAPNPVREAVSARFEHLLRDVAFTGKEILEISGMLEVKNELFHQETGCDVQSFQACVQYIDDKIFQWFGPKVDYDLLMGVWESVA